MPLGGLFPNRGWIPVLAISKVSEHRRVNFVGDRPHGTIAQDELASTGMDAAKMLNVVRCHHLGIGQHQRRKTSQHCRKQAGTGTIEFPTPNENDARSQDTPRNTYPRAAHRQSVLMTARIEFFKPAPAPNIPSSPHRDAICTYRM